MSGSVWIGPTGTSSPYFSGHFIPICGNISMPSSGGFDYPLGSGAVVSGMIVKPEEMAMIRHLQEKPDDVEVRMQYVDYLLDQNRTQSAELVRGGVTPGLGHHRVKALSTPSGG